MAPELPRPTTAWLDAGDIQRSRVPRVSRVLGQAAVIGADHVCVLPQSMVSGHGSEPLIFISPVHCHRADDDDSGGPEL